MLTGVRLQALLIMRQSGIWWHQRDSIQLISGVNEIPSRNGHIWFHETATHTFGEPHTSGLTALYTVLINRNSIPYRFLILSGLFACQTS